MSLALSLGCTELARGGKTYVLDDGTNGEGSSGDGPLVCDSGLTQCGNTCAALGSDASNCGACGRSCLGAACNEGMCAAESVAVGVVDPEDIAVDGTHVYWTTAGGAVQRAPKTGGAIETIAEGQDAPRAIAVDDTFVFWANQGTGDVMRALKNDPGKIKEIMKGKEARRLVLDADMIYFSKHLKKGDISSAKKGGGEESTLVTEQGQPDMLWLLGEQLIWVGTNEEDDREDGPGSYVRFMGSKGGDVTTLAAGEGSISGLAAAAGYAIWSDATNHRIRAMPLDGEEATTWVENQDVVHLTADGETIYWSTAGGTVKSKVVPDGMARILAADVAGAAAVTADDQHVYFVLGGAGGSILRVAK